MYRLLLIFLYPLSLLPMPVLYGISSVARGILFGRIGYRRRVVAGNLAHAFPEKSEADRTRIQHSFEQNFCDQWVETLKALSISKKWLQKRVSGNWEVFEELARDEKNTYALLGHFFNWEWASLACQWSAPQPFAGVYLPLSSAAFDRVMQNIRTRGGGWLVSMKALRAGMQRLRAVPHIVGLIADQNPSQPSTALWLPFMHRDAPFFTGPELLARRASGAVVFASIRREGRGRYRIFLEKKCDDARSAAPEEITRAYVSFLEEELRRQPENWLWSHRRWKHSKT